MPSAVASGGVCCTPWRGVGAEKGSSIGHASGGASEYETPCCAAAPVAPLPAALSALPMAEGWALELGVMAGVWLVVVRTPPLPEEASATVGCVFVAGAFGLARDERLPVAVWPPPAAPPPPVEAEAEAEGRRLLRGGTSSWRIGMMAGSIFAGSISVLSK